MSGRMMAPLVASVVGVATGIYIFQPIVLEQLQKDGALKPEFKNLENSVEKTFGDMTDPTQIGKNPNYHPGPEKSPAELFQAAQDALESKK